MEFFPIYTSPDSTTAVVARIFSHEDMRCIAAFRTRITAPVARNAVLYVDNILPVMLLQRHYSSRDVHGVLRLAAAKTIRTAQVSLRETVRQNQGTRIQPICRTHDDG